MFTGCRTLAKWNGDFNVSYEVDGNTHSPATLALDRLVTFSCARYISVFLHICLLKDCFQEMSSSTAKGTAVFGTCIHFFRQWFRKHLFFVLHFVGRAHIFSFSPWCSFKCWKPGVILGLWPSFFESDVLVVVIIVCFLQLVDHSYHCNF